MDAKLEANVDTIASRLDRFLVSKTIMNIDVFIEAKIMPSLGSDHWPIRLEVDIKNNLGKKPFRFEDFWLRDPEFIKKWKNGGCKAQYREKEKCIPSNLNLKS